MKTTVLLAALLALHQTLAVPLQQRDASLDLANRDSSSGFVKRGPDAQIHARDPRKHGKHSKKHGGHKEGYHQKNSGSPSYHVPRDAESPLDLDQRDPVVMYRTPNGRDQEGNTDSPLDLDQRDDGDDQDDAEDEPVEADGSDGDKQDHEQEEPHDLEERDQDALDLDQRDPASYFPTKLNTVSRKKRELPLKRGFLPAPIVKVNRRPPRDAPSDSPLDLDQRDPSFRAPMPITLPKDIKKRRDSNSRTEARDSAMDTPDLDQRVLSFSGIAPIVGNKGSVGRRDLTDDGSVLFNAIAPITRKKKGTN
ncbi:hypothetical protein BJ741DRAFT_625169 [Chytriomyces cf. hyalinus JEL632]|nr:hypothetical protein BJ741DRAFT_625169 [Chytriomyces cf. hyalinus JEL632]